MSVARCDQCERLIDTDQDPDSTYAKPDQFICEYCRDADQVKADEHDVS